MSPSDNHIKGRCFTKLDDYKHEEWPTVFCTVPLIGHFVESVSGKILKIVNIIHCEHCNPPNIVPSPRIIVELAHRIQEYALLPPEGEK